MSPRSALDEGVGLGALVWLSIAQLAVIAPFLWHVQTPVLPVLIGCVLWRVAALRGRLPAPGPLLKAAAFAAVLGTVLALQPLGLGLDAMIALLLISFAFKSIEIDRRRDALVVIWVAYFLLAASFLYDQSIGTGLYGALGLVCVTSCLLAVQNPNLAGGVGRRAAISTGLLLNCLPLVLLIFVIAPRLPPLWQMPNMGGGARSGVADRMTPGDIARLSQSARLAFRVEFDGPRPPQAALYWRGMTLNHFDGRSWHALGPGLAPPAQRRALERALPRPRHRALGHSRAVDYELLLEPSGQPWLFTLGAVEQIAPDALLAFDHRAVARRPLDTVQLLRVRSRLDALRDPQLELLVRELALQLPAGTDPRARDLARRWRVEAADAPAYVERVLAHYTEQPFHYTLRPPTLDGEDTVDAFLFDTQRGFCAHYAGSFVFLMRAAGIPARVVAGYQGGEWHPEAQYLAVRDYDAHAWAEIWLSGEGWRRVDPTARVAPARVEHNLRSAVRDEGSFLADAPFALARYEALARWRRTWDRAQYQWRRAVIGFDAEAQVALLQRLLGELSPARAALGALIAMAAVLLLLVLGSGASRGRWRPVAAEQRLRAALVAALARRGLAWRSGQSLRQLTDDAALRWPAQAAALGAFSRCHDQLLYAPTGDRRALLRGMRRALRECQRPAPAGVPARARARTQTQRSASPRGGGTSQ